MIGVLVLVWWNDRGLIHTSIFFFPFFFSIPFIIFALLFSLPPSRNSDPGSHGRLFFPPTHHGSCLCFFFSREDFRSFLPSSTRVEWCLPTLGALSSWSFFYFCKYIQNLATAGFELTDQHYWVVAFEGYPPGRPASAVYLWYNVCSCLRRSLWPELVFVVYR